MTGWGRINTVKKVISQLFSGAVAGGGMPPPLLLRPVGKLSMLSEKI